MYIQSVLGTRMTTFIETKFKKSDDQTNIDKNKRYLTNKDLITESLKNNKTILTCFKQLLLVKNVCKISNKHVLNWTCILLGQNYRVAALSRADCTDELILII